MIAHSGCLLAKVTSTAVLFGTAARAAYFLEPRGGPFIVRGMDEGDRDRPSSTRGPGDHPSYGAPLLHPINYQSDYPHESHGRQQPFPSYSSNLVYNVPHSQSYGSLQSYPRQTAAIEVLSSQFAGASQYYVSGEPSSQMGSSHHPPSSQFSSPTYSQYSPAAQGLRYVPSLPNAPPPPPHSEQVDDSEFTQQHHALDDAYNQYQNVLKRTFQNMRDGRLGEASTSLLNISDWLLSHAVELGKYIPTL